MRKEIHVVPVEDQWIVRAAEENEAVFSNRYDAETFARRCAHEAKCEFYLHAKDGTVSKQDSYAHTVTTYPNF